MTMDEAIADANENSKLEIKFHYKDFHHKNCHHGHIVPHWIYSEHKLTQKSSREHLNIFIEKTIKGYCRHTFWTVVS